jgi:hypothetical protein
MNYETQAEEAMKIIFDGLNGRRRKFTEEMAQALLHGFGTHPLLQEYFWLMVQEMAKEYSSRGYSDARNQRSKEFAEQLVQLVEDKRLYISAL